MCRRASSYFQTQLHVLGRRVMINRRCWVALEWADALLRGGGGIEKEERRGRRRGQLTSIPSHPIPSHPASHTRPRAGTRRPCKGEPQDVFR